MLQFDMSAQVRNTFGKGAVRNLRREGISPAIMYGAKSDTLAIQLNAKELTKTMLQLQRRNAVFNLDIEGPDSTSKKHVMIKEIQTDPIDDSLVHTDFLEVALDRPITLKVPVKYTGISKGVDLGGELHVTLQNVTVRGLVLDIPDVFEVDVSDLDIDDALSCEKLNIPSSLELLHNSSDICVSVITAKKEIDLDEEEEEAAPAESEASAE